jgi:hypothetical protein
MSKNNTADVTANAIPDFIRERQVAIQSEKLSSPMDQVKWLKVYNAAP